VKWSKLMRIMKRLGLLAAITVLTMICSTPVKAEDKKNPKAEQKTPPKKVRADQRTLDAIRPHDPPKVSSSTETAAQRAARENQREKERRREQAQRDNAKKPKPPPAPPHN